MGYEFRLVLDSLSWARQFARSCTAKLPPHLDRDDLQSAGVLAYLSAATRFDTVKGASFRGYCAVRIRGAVLDELRRWDWAPRSVYKGHKRFTQMKDILTANLEREPTRDELAAALGIEVTDLAAFQFHTQPRQMVSFDEMPENNHGDEKLPLAERLPDPSADRPDAGVLSAEDRRALVQYLAELPKAQATVIAMHYLHNIPLRQVARELGVTPSRISQLHHEALDRLRAAWQRGHGF